MKKPKPLAQVRLKMSLEEIKNLDGLRLEKYPHLLAFKYKGVYYVIKGSKWSFKDSYSLCLDLQPDLEKFRDMVAEDEDKSKHYIR